MNNSLFRAIFTAQCLALVTSSTALGLGQSARDCMPAQALDSDFPDPSILYDSPANGGVFAYATNIAAAVQGSFLNVPVIRTPDAGLTQWSRPTDALPHLPGWARAGFTWAPAIAHRDGGIYRLYFTARYGFSGRPCIGVATSPKPEGPFIPTDEAKPMICPLAEGGAIDPSIFKDDDGKEYLLWKTDTNCCDGDPTIYVQQLAPDGLSLAGPPVSDGPWVLPNAKALIHRDQPWEGRVIEAPALYKHGGRYYLFYSGGGYASRDYAIGYASASSLYGPFQKADDPLLSATTSSLDGPGGQDVFSGSQAETWIAFHAWREVASKRYRALYFGRIDWKASTPSIMLTCARAPADTPRE